LSTLIIAFLVTILVYFPRTRGSPQTVGFRFGGFFVAVGGAGGKGTRHPLIHRRT